MNWFNSLKIEMVVFCIAVWMSFLWAHKIVAYVNEPSLLVFLMYFVNEGVKNKFRNSISGFAVNQILLIA